MRWVNLYRILANILMEIIKLRQVTIFLANCQPAGLLQIDSYGRSEISDANEIAAARRRPRLFFLDGDHQQIDVQFIDRLTRRRNQPAPDIVVMAEDHQIEPFFLRHPIQLFR